MVGVANTPPPFRILDDPLPEDTTLPAFMVSTQRGFLPRSEPIVSLPEDFAVLESLLQRMPIKTADGSPGLLANGELGQCVDNELPDLTDAVDRHAADIPLMTALYRDYSFLASAYLLEPCHQRFIKGEGYGLGRSRLPASVARPIARAAEIVGFKPFMEYAGSYALYNYRLADPAVGLEYDNLRLVRAFEHGLDPKSSEAGFVLVHVAMVRHSGPLVDGVMKALRGCEEKDRDEFNAGLERALEAMEKVNGVMNTMWNKSKPREYTQFRTFIFGIESQSMFPNGVIYEGISEEPKYFRGESGANDSMIPLCDSLLQTPMPHTPLTDILTDFRSYRPGNHRSFLAWVNRAAGILGTEEFARADETSAGLFVKVLDQVRDFRWRHWRFVGEYVLRHTRHPTATGGSPIVTYLPNQLQAVLEQILDMAQNCTPNARWVENITERARDQLDSLEKEVRKHGIERGVGVEKERTRHSEGKQVVIDNGATVSA